MERTKQQAGDLAKRLAEVDLFAGLSKRELGKLVDVSRVVEHADGHEVAVEGLGSLAFHLVLDGRARVVRDGRTLGTLQAGDHFGEISLIDGKPRSVTVAADGPLTTLAVPHQEFQRLLDREPAFARALLVVLCARLRGVEARA